ncbi:MAG: hypothetical protein KC766_17650 [Myxococcales bacterium]|nr:hypothetical protein [Myxococcales bacterium]
MRRYQLVGDRTARVLRWLCVAGVAASLLSCSGDDETASEPEGVTVPAAGEHFASLAEWHLFSDIGQQTPAPGVEPFQPIAPLYSDYTNKRRFIYVPPGTKIQYSDTGVWTIPVGGALIKTFSYVLDERQGVPERISPDKERLMETRILFRESETKWVAETYVYDQSGQQAERKVAGATIDVSWVNRAGETLTNAYSVPNVNACQTCHGENEAMNAQGLRTRQLNWDHDYGDVTENQVDHFQKLGWIDAPAEREQLVDPFGNGSVSDRMRSYFDSNCASCHREDGFASSSGMWLDWASTDPETQEATNWGVCKQPTSAGGATCELQFDVVPGKPDESILLCRTASAEAKVRMPPLATKIPHAEALGLIREWISQLPAAACSQ